MKTDELIQELPRVIDNLLDPAVKLKSLYKQMSDEVVKLDESKSVLKNLPNYKLIEFDIDNKIKYFGNQIEKSKVSVDKVFDLLTELEDLKLRAKELTSELDKTVEIVKNSLGETNDVSSQTPEVTEYVTAVEENVKTEQQLIIKDEHPEDLIEPVKLDSSEVDDLINSINTDGDTDEDDSSEEFSIFTDVFNDSDTDKTEEIIVEETPKQYKSAAESELANMLINTNTGFDFSELDNKLENPGY